MKYCGDKMARKIPFVKMQGAGNDYVYINAFIEDIPDPEALAKKISDRHFGVGSDGLVLVAPSIKADLRMRMFNADGSEAEMCGNAARCVAKFAWERGLVDKAEFMLETGAGLKRARLNFNGDRLESVTIDMGEPLLEPGLIPFTPPAGGVELPIKAVDMEVCGKKYAITPVGMGNPHAVLFVDKVDGLDLPVLGPHFERHESFPKKTNTEFVELVSPHKIRMRVWERGAGETLACGTGACAALVASVLNGFAENEAEVELRGGSLRIKWDKADNHVYMTGPAETVFEGEYYY